MKTLLLSDWAVFMRKEESFEVDDFLSQLRDLRCEGVVLRAEHLDLGLKVRQPLLLTLTTLESGNAVRVLMQSLMRIYLRGTHRFRSRKFFRFSSSVILVLVPFSSVLNLSSSSSSSSDGSTLPLYAMALPLAFLAGGALAGASSAFLRPLVVVVLFFLPLPRVLGFAGSGSSDIMLPSLPPRAEPPFPSGI